MFGEFAKKIDELYCEEPDDGVAVHELEFFGKGMSEILRPFWELGGFIKEDYDGEYIVITKRFVLHYLNTKRMAFDFADVNHVCLLEMFLMVLRNLDFNKHTLVFSSC